MDCEFLEEKERCRRINGREASAKYNAEMLSHLIDTMKRNPLKHGTLYSLVESVWVLTCV